MFDVIYINNDEGGFGGPSRVAEGTTVQQFLEQKLGNYDPSRYLIRVNRAPCVADQVLHANDRVTLSPTKVDAA